MEIQQGQAMAEAVLLEATICRLIKSLEEAKDSRYNELRAVHNQIFEEARRAARWSNTPVRGQSLNEPYISGVINNYLARREASMRFIDYVEQKYPGLFFLAAIDKAGCYNV